MGLTTFTQESYKVVCVLDGQGIGTVGPMTRLTLLADAANACRTWPYLRMAPNRKKPNWPRKERIPSTRLSSNHRPAQTSP